VIKNAWKHAVFATDHERRGYIPGDVAEQLPGRDLGGAVWFTKEEGEKMRVHPSGETPNRMALGSRGGWVTIEGG
jgi:hypothetical protein